MGQTQYRLRYNGMVLATGYTYTMARQHQATLAREFPGEVTIEAYVDGVAYDMRRKGT